MAGGNNEHGGRGAPGIDPSARVRDLIGRARNLGLSDTPQQVWPTEPMAPPPPPPPLPSSLVEKRALDLRPPEPARVEKPYIPPAPAVAPPVAEPPAQLDLEENDRLPWLESPEEDDEEKVDSWRVALVVAIGLALMAAIVWGVWYISHTRAGDAPVADGSLIEAPVEPWREAPKDPGGKQFDGTGDTSFAVSQGQNRPAQLAGGEGEGSAPQAPASAGASFAGGATEAKPAPQPAPVAQPSADAAPSGGVVQIAAYASQTQAEAGWNRLVSAHEMLKGMNHRIVVAKIDLGTVYRLQILTSAGGGHGLCEKLKANDMPCQVKH